MADSVCLPRVSAKGLIDSGRGQVEVRRNVVTTERAKSNGKGKEKCGL